MTTLLLIIAPGLSVVALAAVAAWWHGRRLPAASTPTPGVAPARAEIDLRRRAREHEPHAALAARVIEALDAAARTAGRPVLAEEVRAGLADPEPARQRLGMQGTPDAYDHAQALAAYDRHPDRDRIAALVGQALTAAEPATTTNTNVNGEHA